MLERIQLSRRHHSLQQESMRQAALLRVFRAEQHARQRLEQDIYYTRLRKESLVQEHYPASLNSLSTPGRRTLPDSIQDHEQRCGSLADGRCAPQQCWTGALPQNAPRTYARLGDSVTYADGVTCKPRPHPHCCLACCPAMVAGGLSWNSLRSGLALHFPAPTSPGPPPTAPPSTSGTWPSRTCCSRHSRPTATAPLR